MVGCHALPSSAQSFSTHHSHRIASHVHAYFSRRSFCRYGLSHLRLHSHLPRPLERTHQSARIDHQSPRAALFTHTGIFLHRANSIHTLSRLYRQPALHARILSFLLTSHNTHSLLTPTLDLLIHSESNILLIQIEGLC